MILVTGATGFVGSSLLSSLRAAGTPARAVMRRAGGAGCDGDVAWIPDLALSVDWRPILSGVHTVVHAAARVHVMRESAADPLAEFRRANVEGTMRLAEQAADAGVRRFVFISSVKVNGESTPLGQPFKADDAPAPEDPYGVSKREAEDRLRTLARESTMDVVIIRPPLIYGPGVKANFRQLTALVQRGVPLPLGAIRNKRSFVALDNLNDLIRTCVGNPAASNQTFLVSDDNDLSTTDLIRRLAKAYRVPSRLLPVPAKVLEGGARLLGRPGIAQRLCGSLQVDIEKTKKVLGWAPPVDVDTALRRLAQS